MTKLFVTDLDGTLLPQGTKVSERNIVAAQRAAAAGVTVTIATGRMYPAALPVAQQLGIDAPIICYNGALICTTSGKELYHQYLAPQTVRSLVDFFHQNGWYLQTFSPDELYFASYDENAKAYEADQHVKGQVVGWDGLKERDQNICKAFSVTKDAEETRKRMDILEQQFPGEITLVQSNPCIIEIVAPNVSKADGIRHLADQMGISMREVMAIGDGQNDLSMLEAAGKSIAMGNAVAEVQKICQLHTGRCADDGWAEAIDQYVLKDVTGQKERTNMKTIKVGIIGMGFIGRQHVEALRRIPGVEIVAITDTNEASGRKACEELFIPHHYTDYKEMLEKEDLDAVHNCTPNQLHYAINKDIIAHGIHVYCEKPLANTSEETEELVQLAKEHNVYAGVNFNYRQNAIVRQMHERIHDEKQAWGRTYLVRGHYLQDWMMYDTDYNWRVVPEIGGPSRTVADIGSHWFDTVQYILGQRIVRVFADLEIVLKQRKKARKAVETFQEASEDMAYDLVDVQNEDMAFVMVEFEDGTKGQVTLSQLTGGHKNDLEVSVDGSRYSMTWRQENADKLLVEDRREGSTIRYAGAEFLSGDAVRYASLPSGHAVGWADAFRNGMREFYRTVRDGAPQNYASFADASRIVKIVEACMKSSREGRWVEV